MKRFLCVDHAHHFKAYKKGTTLSSDHCSICRWNNRTMTLKDFAQQLEEIAVNMRFAYDHSDYDPFGITFCVPFEDIIIQYLKWVHKSYRDNFLKRLSEQFKEYEND